MVLHTFEDDESENVIYCIISNNHYKSISLAYGRAFVHPPPKHNKDCLNLYYDIEEVEHNSLPQGPVSLFYNVINEEKIISELLNVVEIK